MAYVYMLASRRSGTLYVGAANDLVRRVYEHKGKLAPGFTKRYGIDKLVWFEQTDVIESAIRREKRIKDSKRAGRSN